ncbi:phage minor capsid protein [Cytobacillus sp. Bac17]|uniref:phage minor capsid protein n=1 Tax=Cytobacillus sp. Bac17 TaxID=2926008 RepID=UPI002117C7ED|nr:phage minor capsid protein [Cytobacillus sp. Bac17]
MEPLRQQQLTTSVVEVFLSIEEEILLNIAKILEQGKSLLEEDLERWQTEKLGQLGKLTQQNIITISKYAELSIETVTAMLEEAGYEAVTDSEMELIEAVAQGILLQPPLPKESPVLEAVLVSFQRQARETFNLINTTMLDQSQRIYLNILNETTGKVLAGTKTPRQALAETAARWAEHGVPALIRKDGAKMSAEAYVSMVTRSMSNSVANEMQFARMDEYGADLVEVSSHMGARPKCAKYQGKIFSRSGSSNKYPPLSSTSYGEPDGLRGINCRHVFYPYIEGFSKRVYKPYPAAENRKVYEESQKQRHLERVIRKAKRQLAVAEVIGEIEAIDVAKKKVRQRQANMRAFIDDTGRTRRYEREKAY